MKPLDLIISLQEVHGSEDVVNDILRIGVQSLSHMRLWDPLDCSTPGFPIHDHLLELVQTLVHGWWCHSTISSSVTPFSSCPQSFPASESFPMSQLFTPGGQSIGTSALESVFPMNFQGWFPLGLTGLVSLLSKGLSRVFSSTTIQKHQFFSTQLFLWFDSHIPTWLLGKL